MLALTASFRGTPLLKTQKTLASRGNVEPLQLPSTRIPARGSPSKLPTVCVFGGKKSQPYRCLVCGTDIASMKKCSKCGNTDSNRFGIRGACRDCINSDDGQMECYQCRGEGVIKQYKWSLQPPFKAETGSDPCSLCNGKKKLRCRVCGGKREVVFRNADWR
eukprot:jgi/Mesvir1/28258/Mv04794-RA.1